MLDIQDHVELSGHIMERTVKKMKQFFARMLQQVDAGITVDQWVVLNILNGSDGLNQFEIARQCYKDAPTITRIIDILVNKKLVQRREDSEDRRRFKIYLTREGREKIESLQGLVRQFRTRSYANIPSEDLQKLQGVMNTIFENLDNIPSKS